ncbi:MAG: peptidoglycan-associated lipoprotein Pal [Candidatus Eisenbacteria bacterium]
MLRKSILLPVLVLLVAGLVLCGGCAKKKVVPTTELPTAPARAPAERVEQPTAQPEEGPDEVTEAANMVASRIEDVYFAFDDYSLTEKARTTLAGNAKLLADNPTVKILIEGHCDERGTVEYNLALGEKRALSAKNYLVNYGVDAGRISVISYGKERPFNPGHSEEAWAQNRRAHFVVQK